MLEWSVRQVLYLGVAKRIDQATAYMRATVFPENFSRESQEGKPSKAYAYTCGERERKQERMNIKWLVTQGIFPT